MIVIMQQQAGPGPTDAVVRRTPDVKRREDGALTGSVIIVDRFGNLVTNIGARLGGIVQFGGAEIAVRRTYSDVAEGETVALAGSSGFIEIAVRGGSAAQKLSARRGDPVVWKAS